MGKTHIVQKFVRDHPSEFDAVTGTTRTRVTAMQMPPEPLEKDFYDEMLIAMGAVVSVSSSMVSVRSRARTFARQFGLRLLIVDEIHAMLAGTYRQQRIFLNSIRLLANDLHLPLLCIGTHEAHQALLTDQQLADRFAAFELPRWQDDTAFAQLLKTFAAILPLRSPSDLCRPKIRQRILSLTEGVTVRICRVLEAAAITAITGGNERMDFPDNRAVQCLYCEHDLAIRRRIRTPDSPEPLIVAFERSVIEVLAGEPPDPAWAGDCTARAFRDVLSDLEWMFTTVDLVGQHYGQALVDRIATGFSPRHPYGEDFEPRFHARPWPQREAVVCAMIQVLRGSDTDDALGVSKYRRNFAEFRPFVEILRAVNRNQPHLWSRIRGWPGHLQDRAGQALRMVEWHRSTTRRQRKTALIRQIEAGTFVRPGV